MDWQIFLIVCLALFVGGILKGATGAGTPVIAVPVIAIFSDVRFAVIIFAYPNLLTNIWQTWQYHSHLGPKRLWLGFAVGGFVGAFAGTFLLLWLPADILRLTLALIIIIYITFRIIQPDWVLARSLGAKLSVPIGAFAGVFYGAVALSAPVSITFLNAMRLKREEFIAIISTFFLAMGLSQLPTLYAFGALNPQTHVLGLIATVASFAGLPVGARIARKMSAQAFDRVILTLLGLIALRMLYGQFF